MEKEFVNNQQALMLYKLGFNEPCFKYLWTDKSHSQWMHKASGNFTYHHQQYFKENSKIFTISVPTYSQAFEWFRDNYDVHSSPQKFNEKRWWVCYGTWSSPAFESFEEAESALLDYFINIAEILNKSNLTSKIIKVREAGLSERTKNTLLRNQIDTLNELTKYNSTDLLCFIGLGKKGLAEIEAIMTVKNLFFKVHE